MPPVLLIVSALAALLVGPLFALIWSRGRAWRAIIDGLSLSLVGGICLLISVPHGLELAGPWALGAAILGALTPGWTHRLSARWERNFGYAGLALLAAHAAVDGAALTMNGGAMGVAVIAHRLPMGLAVYSAATRSSASARHGFAAVGVLVLATLGGALLGAPISALGGPVAHGVFEAFVAGLLLHIVFEHAPVFPAPESADLLGHGHHHGPGGHAHDHGHHHHHEHSSAWEAARAGGSRWSAVGAFVGLVAIAVLLSGADDTHQHAHHDHGPDFLELLFTLLRASAPPLALGYLAALVWSSVVAPQPLAQLRSRSPLSGALRGLVLRGTRRICACSIVPAHEQLVRRGAPVAATMAFLVAGPALDVVSVVVSIPLLGSALTGIRVAAIVTLAVAVAVWFRAEPARPDTLDPTPAPPPFRERMQQGIRFTVDDLVDHTFPWVAVGMVLACYAALVLPRSGIAMLPGLAQVPILAVLGIPAYVCATGATPALASLGAHGLAPGAAVALLVAGPALNLPALATVRTLIGTRAAVQLTLLVVGVATIAGLLVTTAQLPLPSLPTASLPPGVELASGLLLVAMAARSTLRQGARGLVAQIVEPIESRGVHHH